MKPNLQIFLKKVITENIRKSDNLFICPNLFQVLGLIKFYFKQAEEKKISIEKLQKILQICDRMLKDISFPYKITWFNGEPYFCDHLGKEKYEPIALFHILKMESK